MHELTYLGGDVVRRVGRWRWRRRRSIHDSTTLSLNVAVDEDSVTWSRHDDVI